MGLIRTFISKIRSNPAIFRWIMGVFWVFGLGILVWVIWNNQEVLIKTLTSMRFEFFLYALTAYLGALVVVSIAWAVLVDVLAPGQLPYWEHMKIFVLTQFSKRLPGTIWYVGGRLALYQHKQIQAGVIALAAGVEYALTVVTGLLAGSLILVFTRLLDQRYIWLALLVSVVGLGLMHPWSLSKIFRFFLRTSTPVNLNYRGVLFSAFFLFLTWGFGGLMLALLIQSVYPITISDYLFVVGVWSIAGALGLLTMFLPSSFGVTEISLVALLTGLLPLYLATAIAIVTRVFTTLIELFLAALFQGLARLKQP